MDQLLKKRIISLREDPVQKGFIVFRSKPEVTKVISYVKMVGKLGTLPIYLQISGLVPSGSD